MTFQLIPAIDIKGGKVVRLVQGKFDNVTQYATDPVQMARHWEKEGAKRLHIVDLDGAQSGHLANHKIIQKIADAVKIPIQVGGGIRSMTMMAILLDKRHEAGFGVDRVILGTSIIENRRRKSSLAKALERWQGRIAVSLDCKNGFVAFHGWTQTTDIKGLDLAQELEGIGVKCLIYTDIARDGMLTGPNFEGIEEVLKTVSIPVIASGGIGKIEDVQKLLVLKSKYKNLVGAITGKAIYEGTLNFREACKLYKRNSKKSVSRAQAPGPSAS